MDQGDARVIGATRFAVGLSQIIRVTPDPFAYRTSIKAISGGTLELLSPRLSGTSTAAGFSAGSGWPFIANEVVSWIGPASYYLMSSGATTIVSLVTQSTNGATLL